MSNTSIIAMVVDRAHIANARIMAQAIEKPTSSHGWTQGLNLFEAMDNHQYLFMVADGVARCVRAEPVVMSIEHLQNLHVAVNGWAVDLEGQAMWMLLVDKKTEAKIRKILAKATKAAA